MPGSDSIFQGLLAARNQFSTHVYTGPVRAASQRLGLHSLLRSVEKEVTKQLPGPNVSIDVGEKSCTFYNDSLEEYRWFSMYPETDGEMPVLGEIIDSIEPDDSFWDVGGNIGIYSCFAATEIESGSITVVEPHPKNAERIRKNLERNGGVGTVHELALASGECELTFHPASFDVAGSFGSARYEHRNESMTVKGVPGDRFVKREGVSPPNVVKIDVEGAELDVLRGMENTLSRSDCRAVYCDVCSEWNGIDDREIYRLLQTYGFEVERIWDWPDGRGHYVRATK